MTKIIEITKNERPFLVHEYTRPFWQKLQKGLWERETFEVLDKFLNPNHLYVDVGSWIGPTVLYGAQTAKRSYALEPDPVAFAQLRANVNLNPKLASKIELHNYAIAEKNGQIRLGNRNQLGDSMTGVLFANAPNSFLTDAITLEEFFERNDIKDCNLIKIDIEGGEVSVIPQSKDFFRRTKIPLYLSLHPLWFEDKEKNIEAVIDGLSSYGKYYDKNFTPMRLREIGDILKREKLFEIIATS